MTKPKIKECPFCQTMNRINLKTCSACLSHLEVKPSLKKKHNELLNTSWAASVKKHRNSSRIVNSAQHSISKLNALGYNPILFLGHQDNKGQVTGDMIHHVEQIDGVVLEILKNMRKLYDDLLRQLFSLQANGSINGAPAAEAVPLASSCHTLSSSSSCDTPPSSSSSCHTPSSSCHTPCMSSCALSPSVSTAPTSITPSTSSSPAAGATAAKKRNKHKIKAPIQTKKMVLDKTTLSSGSREEDGIVIGDIKNNCSYTTQTSEASQRDVQHVDEDLCKKSCPFSMSLKEYEGLKFIMNKRLDSIEKQMEEVFNTYRKMWMDPTSLQVVKEEEEEGEEDVWNEISMNLSDSDSSDEEKQH